MSRDRIRPDAGWGVTPDHPRGPHGHLMCRCGCGVETQPPRRTFAGKECVRRFKLQTQPGYARKCVWRRDHGLCGACGLDCIQLIREADRLGKPSSPERQAFLVQRGFPKGAWQDGQFWQADHIVAVADGGGLCGLEGLQTLCWPCHQRKTKVLVADLARRRREQKTAASI